jgi:hypothetical protein
VRVGEAALAFTLRAEIPHLKCIQYKRVFFLLSLDNEHGEHPVQQRQPPEGHGYFSHLSTCDQMIVNPLTPELTPSAQRCLASFLLGILLLEPCISLIYA